MGTSREAFYLRHVVELCKSGSQIPVGSVEALIGGDASVEPMLVEGSSRYTNVTIASTDGSAYWTGVNQINGFFHADVRLATGAVSHGTWTDGEALVASKGNVAAVNVGGTVTMLREAERAGVRRFVFVSSLGAEDLARRIASYLARARWLPVG